MVLFTTVLNKTIGGGERLNQATDILLTLRMTLKFYDYCLRDVREQYQLSDLELKIIGFLYNHPSKDTVGDIAEHWMISKGNVSRSADSLIQKGFLNRIPDQNDRRWVHLHLLAKADPIIRAVQDAGEQFSQQILAGFSPEELARYADFNQRLTQNIQECLRRSNCNEE